MITRNDEKPRLLVLASTYPRWEQDPEPGFVHELSKRLTSEFAVLVVCPGAAGARRRGTMEGVKVERFRYAPERLQLLVNNGGITTNLKRSPWKYALVPGFLLSTAWSTFRSIRRFKPDIVHAHWLIPQGLIAAVAIIAGGRPAPLVVTSHGADLYAWRGNLFSRLKSIAVKRAQAVTVVSAAMVEEVVRLGGEEARIHVSPMGVDLVERFTPQPGVERNPGEILFVGRLVEKKGLRILIDAMPRILAQTPGARLVVAGFGPEDSERVGQVRMLGLESVVQFLGAVPQHRLPDLYRRASVFVAPFTEAAGGDRDGLGLVSVEAAGCGCPVVVSKLPAVEDIFGNGEATFVPPGDVRSLASAVLSVLDNPPEAPRPSRDDLVRKFDWSSVSARYAGILWPHRART